MTEGQTASSLAEHAVPLDAGAHVVAAAFLDGAPALALADGVVLIGDPKEQKRVVAHPDAAIMTAVSDGKTLLTGGDDGRVVAVRADGGLGEIADEKRESKVVFIGRDLQEDDIRSGFLACAA